VRVDRIAWLVIIDLFFFLIGDIDNPGLGDTRCHRYLDCFKVTPDVTVYLFSLRTLFHKPPIGGKELVNLPPHLLHGFKLRPGQVRDRDCRLYDVLSSSFVDT
jgi:hypothetical protein